MFGLTSLGTLHTAIGLVALLAAATMLLRHGAITLRQPLASVYLWSTAITCLTGFGIFQRGGVNIAHALGVLTLVVLVVAVIAGRRARDSAAARYVETIGFSATVFFHLIPGITETFSRFPRSAPLFTGPEDPQLERVIGGVFVLFLLGVGWQLRRLRGASRAARPEPA